ncbi:unnamed protein product [Brassicogethes aeneus]|uniref:Major facilitator superfamily domain-containing protein 12-like n=1 Tax=Brassicogethes aeneus TaxID=1431903 RepID=A0A9P0FNW7_BRAAE|nr:unnamed protein product [Brassicogethes aeneus]
MDLTDRRGPNSCSSLHKISFGLGHIYNDLCAAMWFSYTLFYFQVVLQINSTSAGILLMLGQIIDAIATPLAGWIIDYTNSKRIWHFIGTIAVSIGFSLIFSLKSTTVYSSVLLYYGLVITLFQVGWAVVQISHLSLIPEISKNHNHSSDLTAIRATNENMEMDGIRETIATVPLVCYIASFLTAIFLKFRLSFCGDKIIYFIGSVYGLCASMWITIGIPLTSNWQLYCVAILLGISGSATMVASLCLTANFVKSNGYGGGFVYSIVTFTDKFISGFVVLLVQNMQCSPISECPHYYEHVLSYISGGVSLVGIVSLGLLQWQIKNNGRRNS